MSDMVMMPDEDLATIPTVDPYAAKGAYYTASSQTVVENGRRIQITTDFNGKVTRTDIGPADQDTTTTTTTTTTNNNQQADEVDENVFARLRSYLSDYGLTSLEGMLNDLLARGIEDEASVLYELRGTDVFKKRFAANQARQAAGLPALTPRSYVDMENTYREVLRRGGMLEYFNRQDVFESLIAGDVSPSELYDRMTNAYQVVRDADPAVKAQMQRLYNVEEKDLAAYFLEPKTSVSMLKRRADAAKIAAIGQERSGMQLSAPTAEDIAARGYTAAQAAEAFGTIGRQAELYEPLQGGEERISEQQRVGAAFGYDTAAALDVERRKAARLAQFRGGGQFAATTGATSGTIQTGAGTAQ